MEKQSVEYNVVLYIITTWLMALVIMFLWNGLMPNIFGLPKLDFWQTVLLRLLCETLTTKIEVKRL